MRLSRKSSPRQHALQSLSGNDPGNSKTSSEYGNGNLSNDNALDINALSHKFPFAYGSYYKINCITKRGSRGALRYFPAPIFIIQSLMLGPSLLPFGFGIYKSQLALLFSLSGQRLPVRHSINSVHQT